MAYIASRAGECYPIKEKGAIPSLACGCDRDFVQYCQYFYFSESDQRIIGKQRFDPGAGDDYIQAEASMHCTHAPSVWREATGPTQGGPSIAYTADWSLQFSGSREAHLQM